MAWTAPATAVANTVLTAAFWNTEVRDHFLETAPAKAAAAGDTFYATAANAIAKLAAGAANGGLYMQAAGIPSWLQPVAYRMPRANAAGNLMEYVAGLNLAQAPVFARSSSAQNMGVLASTSAIVSQSFTSVGGIVIVLFATQTAETKSATAEYVHLTQLTRAGSAIGDSSTEQGFSNGASNLKFSLSGIYAGTPGAGTATWTVQAGYQSGNTSGTPTANAQMIIVEMAP